MNLDELVRASLSELARDIEPTSPDPVAVRARVNRSSRIHAITATAVAAAAVVVVILVGSALTHSSQRGHEPIDQPTPTVTQAPKASVTRELTYAVGSTIHWGDRTIDVAKQANNWGPSGKLVEFVDATDDGAVFVVGPPPYGNFQTGELTIPVGPSAVWFTDGSAPVRIGTTVGDMGRGFRIAPTAEGSILAWVDPGSKTHPGQIVVYDTARMSEVARFGTSDADPLAVYPDVVYWSPTGTGCSAFPGGTWGRDVCQGIGPVMRFDTTSGQQTRVSRAAYLADRRTRPGLLIQSDSHAAGSLFVGFGRRGDRLVADPGTTVALTGQPPQLRIAAGNRQPNNLYLTQWLDPDQVVLVGTDDSHRDHDLFVCRLSTGSCGLAVRIPDADLLIEPGPAIGRG